MSSIAVIDYGMGNLRSVQKALEHVAPGVDVHVTSDAALIAAAERVIFPGQGAIGDAMRQLAHMRLLEPLRTAVVNKPFLGICLGLQALFDHSEEDGGTDGLAVFPGRVKRFPARTPKPEGGFLKVPHMGWNTVHQTHPHPMWRHIAQDSRFYFVHSYYVEKASASEVIGGVSDYGLEFVCAAARGNVFAVQFHPEKSQHAGLQLLKNFTAWRPEA